MNAAFVLGVLGVFGGQVFSTLTPQIEHAAI
jgi:hypothetical protein